MQRRQEFSKSVHVLVDNQLRPGADASRADATCTSASQSARAQQQESISRALLADILGTGIRGLKFRKAGLLDGVPGSSPAATSVSANPAAQAQQARVEEAQSQVHILDRSYYPKFYLHPQSTDAEAVWIRPEVSWRERRTGADGPTGPRELW